MRCATLFIVLVFLGGCATPQRGVSTASDNTNINQVLQLDDRWNEHRDYLNQLLKTVQAKWWAILAESRLTPPRGSHVTIAFKLNSKGETDIIKVEDAGAGKLGVFTCQNAITYAQPYRRWTDQMIAVLGEEQTITIGFYYQ